MRSGRETDSVNDTVWMSEISNLPFAIVVSLKSNDERVHNPVGENAFGVFSGWDAVRKIKIPIVLTDTRQIVDGSYGLNVLRIEATRFPVYYAGDVVQPIFPALHDNVGRTYIAMREHNVLWTRRKGQETEEAAVDCTSASWRTIEKFPERIICVERLFWDAHVSPNIFTALASDSAKRCLRRVSHCPKI
jgi:hypothetical protein